jgi:hypothetical protein
LETIFCAAPIITASINGVVPNLYARRVNVTGAIIQATPIDTYCAVIGAKNFGNIVSAKKPAPEVRSVMGVMREVTRQPNLLKMN